MRRFPSVTIICVICYIQQFMLQSRYDLSASPIHYQSMFLMPITTKCCRKLGNGCLAAEATYHYDM